MTKRLPQALVTVYALALAVAVSLLRLIFNHATAPAPDNPAIAELAYRRAVDAAGAWAVDAHMYGRDYRCQREPLPSGLYLCTASAGSYALGDGVVATLECSSDDGCRMTSGLRACTTERAQ